METPCEGCPFRDMPAMQKLEAIEGDGCGEVLCHESQCLDGDLPDRRCVGFHGGEVWGQTSTS